MGICLIREIRVIRDPIPSTFNIPCSTFEILFPLIPLRRIASTVFQRVEHTRFLQRYRTPQPCGAEGSQTDLQEWHHQLTASFTGDR